MLKDMRIGAYFHAKWRLLCLLSFKYFLATSAVLKIGKYTWIISPVLAGEY